MVKQDVDFFHDFLVAVSDYLLSFLRKQESNIIKGFLIPAFAGMTVVHGLTPPQG